MFSDQKLAISPVKQINPTSTFSSPVTATNDDGKEMCLLPYDGAPELLDKAAILRDELFADIAAANPRSVTVFLDTCYSGTTRGPDMLIASRPIAIGAKEQSVPEGFTVMTQQQATRQPSH